MKLRTQHLTSIAMIATITMYGLCDILFDRASYGGALEQMYSFLCFAMTTATLLFLWRYMWLEIFKDYWADTDAIGGSFRPYPVRKFDWLLPNALDESMDVQIHVKIAGVDNEVCDTTTPDDYGLNAFISYVVHKDDLCFMDEEELVCLINKTYHCNYKVNEK